MHVSVVPWLKARPSLRVAVELRSQTPEHQHDNGCRLGWQNANVHERLYLVVGANAGTEVAIGILFADGPPHETCPAWWVDSSFRGTGLSGKVIDAFAELLKSQGVVGIGRVTIDTFAGQYHEQSSALAKRLGSHFAPERRGA